MAQGKVKWFDKERGFGFISPLGGDEDVFVEDFFVRNSGRQGAGSRNLKQGERVAYQLTQDRWGSTAKNVCILRTVAAPPTDRPQAVRAGATTR
jgi:CspA family cold shock protein